MPQSKEGKRYLRSALALAVAGAFAAMHPAWADVPELETNSDGAYINVTAGTGTGETQSVTGDAVSITNSGNAHALTLTGTGNTILIDGTESVSITANSQYAPISNFSGNPWAETPSSYSVGGTIDIESDGTVTLSNTAGGNNQVIDIENGDSDTPLKLTVNGEKTAAQVVMTGNVLTQNENTAAEINLTGTDSSLTGQVYAKDGAAITLNVDPKTGSTATVTGSGLADGTDSVMTVNANNAVLNGGYYALDGGTTTVTLTGNSVQTAPEKTSGFSAVHGSLPTREEESIFTCTSSSCVRVVISPATEIKAVIGSITEKNVAGGAMSGSSFTEITESGTQVTGDFVAEDESTMKLSIGGTLDGDVLSKGNSETTLTVSGTQTGGVDVENGSSLTVTVDGTLNGDAEANQNSSNPSHSDLTLTINGSMNGMVEAWDYSTGDVTVSGSWVGESTAYYTGENSVSIIGSGSWTGDGWAYCGGTFGVSVADGAKWSGDAYSTDVENGVYAHLTADIAGTWEGDAKSDYGAVLNANIKETGVWTGDAVSTDSYDDKASEVHVDNARVWNGDARADGASLLTVDNSGTWTGDASTEDTGSSMTITSSGTWNGSAAAASGSVMTIDVSGAWTGDAKASDSGTTLTITDSGVWNGSATAESGAAVTVSDLNQWTGDATATGSGSTMGITNTGVWSGNASASDGASLTVSNLKEWTGDAKATGSGSTMEVTDAGVWNGSATVADSVVMTVGALQTWNGNATVTDSGSKLTVSLPGTWNGNASVSAGTMTLALDGTWTGDAAVSNAGRMDVALNGTWNGSASVTSNGIMTVDMNGTWNGNVSATKGSAVALNIKGTWNGAVVEASEDSTVDITDNTSSNTETKTETTADTTESTSSTHGVLRFARLLAVNTASNDLTDTSDTTEATGTGDAADAEEESTPAPGVSVNFEGDNVSWNLTGDSELSGLNIGDGTISFPTPASGESFTGTTLTVNGDYTASNATLNMSASLSGENSASDLLTVTGAATGATTINVTAFPSTGEPKADGVELVSVTGDSSNATFTMPRTLKSGAYIYSLRKAGSGWYLMNTVETPETVSGTVIPGTSDLSAHVIRPEIASYANNLYAANTMFAMKLSDRLGETAYSDAIKAAGKKAGSFWIRTAGGHTRNVMADGENTTRGNWGLVQLGGDLISWPTSGTHRMHVGLMAGYAHESNKTGSDTADYSSKGKVSGFSGGLYATWMNSNATGDGPYVDAWLQYQRFKNTTSVGNYAEEESYHSKGFTGSLEAGYTFALKDWQNGAVSNATRLRLEGQVIRMGVRADNVIDSTGTLVQGTGAGNVRTRLGATLFHQFTNTAKGTAVKPYLTLNWVHDTKSFGTAMDGVHDTIDGGRNFGEVKLGVEGRITKNLNLWAYTGYQGGDHGYRNVEALVGVKALF